MEGVCRAAKSRHDNISWRQIELNRDSAGWEKVSDQDPRLRCKLADNGSHSRRNFEGNFDFPQ
jgi:hypothetical protein